MDHPCCKREFVSNTGEKWRVEVVLKNAVDKGMCFCVLGVLVEDIVKYPDETNLCYAGFCIGCQSMVIADAIKIVEPGAKTISQLTCAPDL